MMAGGPLLGVVVHETDGVGGTLLDVGNGHSGGKSNLLRPDHLSFCKAPHVDSAQKVQESQL